MLLKDFIKKAVDALLPLYEEAEARSLVMMLCQERLGVMSWTHVVDPKTTVPEEELDDLQEDIDRMAAGEPIQYVLGYTEFRGRIFKTDRRALIPRIETELLVEEVVRWWRGRGEPRVLDLCTGSGCIAWSLAYEIPGAVVTGADLSEDALALARSQFRRLPRNVVRPVFMKGDILDFSTPFPECDVFTANPPYITLQEKEYMRPNVLDWEPEMALFAPESDPLAFHKALALWAAKLLSPGGFGIVEINEDLGPDCLAVFSSLPADAQAPSPAAFRNVRLVEDFAGKPRFVAFEKG